MVRDYRQMLIDQKTHDEIKAAKVMLSSIAGKRLSSREVISEFLGRRLRFLSLSQDIRAYINAFVSSASLNKDVLGVMLFGSVARNKFGRYSDIDMLVVVAGKTMDRFGEICEMVNRADTHRKALIASGLHLRIRPMLLSIDELGSFRPIYIDLLEDGIVLFERNDVLFNFMNEIRKSVEYERKVVGDAVVVKWRIKG